ncbi:nitrite reductase small subunit NirD [Gammaproteobacteria bacterium AS21]|jgi:nitrite reductase (NADH) small subunit
MNKSDSWTSICKLQDIAPNTGVCAKFENQQVALFHIQSKSLHGQSQIRAISNYDPYSQANVLSRGLITEHDKRYYVASPLLKQQFCLETGHTNQDDDICIPTFSTRVDKGIVQIRTGMP